MVIRAQGLLAEISPLINHRGSLVYVSPIEARCRHCAREFCLSDLLGALDGACPHCARLLSPEWTSLLLEESRTADKAMMLLVRALRRLNGLPGNLELLPHSVLRNLFEEVGWEEELSNDPAGAQEELRFIRLEVESWERLAELGDRNGLSERVKEFLSRKRGSGKSVSQPNESAVD
jgi:hypothetical protein